MEALPPVWLGVGELDPLLGDTLELVDKLRAAGVPSELVRYPDLPHAFVMLNRLLAPAVAAVDDASAAVRRMLGLDAPAA
jgi:acetyl esterase